MLRVKKKRGWLIRGLLAAEGNHHVTVHIRDLGVEKLVRSLVAAEGNCGVTVHIRDLWVERLGLKPMPDCEH